MSEFVEILYLLSDELYNLYAKLKNFFVAGDSIKMESQRALPKITEVFPYWQDINSTDRLAMARQVQYHALPRGKIFCINDAITVSSLYVISGEVCYYTINADGRDTTLYRLHRGQYTSFLEAKLYTNPN